MFEAADVPTANVRAVPASKAPPKKGTAKTLPKPPAKQPPGEPMANVKALRPTPPKAPAKKAAQEPETPPPSVNEQKPHRRKFSSRKEQADVVKTLGARLRAAREMCNLSQQTAAKRLGYNNPSRLCRLEKGLDNSSVPLWLILRAAQVYQVSVDWLFGTTDDCESGLTIDRETSAWLMREWERARARDMAVIRRMNSQINVTTEILVQMLVFTRESREAMERVRVLNPDFDDMRAGSKLLTCVNDAANAAELCLRRLQRWKKDCQLAAMDSPQIPLFS